MGREAGMKQEGKGERGKGGKGAAYDAVGFSNGPTTLTYRGEIPTAGEWTTFVVPLTGTDGWWKDPEKMYGEHLAPATPDDLMQLLLMSP
jgi:hypothetical protein